MDLNPIVLSIPIYLILIAIELIYDLITKRKLYRLNDAIANISCGITEQVTGVFVKVFTIAVYVFFYEQFRITEVPHTWYWAVILFIGVDFFYYWAHRYSHTVNLFWLGHVIHHQSEDYNFSVALRQGVFQKVFTAIFFIPLAIVGFDPEWFLYIGAFSTLYQFWIHTELIDKMGWFGYVFNTPSHHRVHHGRDPKYIDKNHGGTFIVFDRIFGTFQAEEERPTYGVTTPVQTFDPIKVHLIPFYQLGKDLWKVNGILNKLKVLFMPPGWLPIEDGGMRYPNEVDKKHYQKYDQKYSNGLGWYILTQYFIVLGISAMFLFTVKEYSVFNLIFSFAVLLSVMAIGKISDNTSSAQYIEFIRLIFLGSFLYKYFDESIPIHFLLSTILVYTLLSLVLFVKLKINLKTA